MKKNRVRILLPLLVLSAVFVLLLASGSLLQSGTEASPTGQNEVSSDEEAPREALWLLPDPDNPAPAKEISSGFDGLSFSRPANSAAGVTDDTVTGGSAAMAGSGSVSGDDAAHAGTAEDSLSARFCLTGDSETGLQYAYVPAEMNGPLQLHMHPDETLLVEPAPDEGQADEGQTDEEQADGGQTGEEQTDEGQADGGQTEEWQVNEEPADEGQTEEGQADGESSGEDSPAADGVSGTFRDGDILPVFPENHPHTFTILDGDGQASGTKTVIFLYTENVPSMFIETDSGSMSAINDDKQHETSESATYRIYLTDGTPDAGGRCTVKGRGNSTWSQKKRPYNLNLDQENVLLGMNACRKYALIANYWDSTQTRQYYAFLTAERFGLEYTPQTQFVNVYLNGKYHSLCLLTQRLNVNGGTVAITNLDKANKKANKDSLKKAGAAAESQGTGNGGSGNADETGSQDAEKESGQKAGADSGQKAGESSKSEKELPEAVVMETDEKGREGHAYAWENNPADITGGYLIEFQARYKKEYVWFSTETEHMSFKSPETPSVEEYNYIADYVREAEKALFADDWTNPDTGQTCFDYFDMDSWARMYLIQDFFVQSDDEYYSFYFYKKAGDPLLYCGPVWDFDLCLGNMNCGDYYRTSAQTLWLKDSRKEWLHRMEQDPVFRERLADLYLEELEPILRSLLENEYDETVDRLETDTNLNYLRWHKNLNYRERTDNVRTLLETRVQFLHDYYIDPGAFHCLLFHFAWGDFSYYVRDGETMGFLPTYDYGEKQSSYQRESNGFITAWQDTETGEWLTPDTVITDDHEYDPVYIP